MSEARVLLPREHGAWGMLLVPFVAACLLAREWNAMLLVALAAVLTVFVMREPLIVLARQKWVWRDPHAESAAARQSLLWEAPLATVCGSLLVRTAPPVPILMLGGAAVALTVTAVWMTIRNRQRSMALQVASAFGLGSSALLVSAVAAQNIETWAWRLWLFASLHALGGVCVVHTRLDYLASQRNPSMRPKADRMRRITIIAIAGIAAVAAAAAILYEWRVGVPPAISAMAFTFELARVRTTEPLRRVGFRALGASIVQALVSVWALG